MRILESEGLENGEGVGGEMGMVDDMRTFDTDGVIAITHGSERMISFWE
jgi:hypothetical protein